eukprot:XP_001701338.1 predicted protein [Chlamydomonas reinhardtii]
MQYLQNVAGCKLPLGNNLDDVFLRLDPSNEQRVQALVCDAVLRPLLGTDARWGFSLGDPIDLFWAGGSGAGPRRCFNSERRDFNDFCWDPWSAALYFVCGKAVLKLLGDEVELVAGSILEEGEADGEGPAARFYWPHTLVSDGAGSLLVVDGGNLRRIRRLQLPASWQWAGITAAATGGRVETLVTGLPERASCYAVLPNGFLALGEGSLILLDLGLQPLLPQMPVTAAAAAAVAAPPPPRSLPADLGALLDAQPDGTADLTVRVGERRFHCHRGILSARCDYFRQRLVGDGFADARAAELELPDTDADAFALLLRWLYTGTATIAVDQACGVAELADRLLLPELLGVALAVVAESVSAATVIDKLLWAAGCCETRGEGFGGLLAQLKAWYVQHHEQVAAEAGAGRKRLVSEAPELMIELMDAVAVWCTDAGAKRARRS